MVMFSPQGIPWIILFLPLAACGLITAFTLKSKTLSRILAIGSLAICFVLSLKLFGASLGHPEVLQTSLPWLTLGPLNLGFGILVDHITIVMLLVVTGIGSLIFLYSHNYMHDDESYCRYYACLCLFAFSMLGIVLSNNFAQMFIFWELVGVSSYALIGFWYIKPEAADAGKKAFMVNRVGDFGFTIGILMVWVLSGILGGERTLNFTELSALFPQISNAQAASPALLTTAGLLIFCGVLGKSAQFPLHVWLPDAMEGPTPVSALIHAATMVAAGIYLIARTYFLFSATAALQTVIACTGGITMIMAASMALVQNDIKRILAYSTLSQLGYMVMSMGFGDWGPGMYHLTTHAFFKALLFLGAGSIIHALHTQDIWEMGGLTKKMPITSWTFLIGSLALAGILPLSGFYSKDEILLLAKEHSTFLYILGSVTAGLTAFYMGRICWVAILGPARSEHHHSHESPWGMTLPLVLLAVFSIIAGWMGIPHYLQPEAQHHGIEWAVALPSLAIALTGIVLSYIFYVQKTQLPVLLKKNLKEIHELIVKKYFMDDIYDAFVRYVQQGIANFCGLFERSVIMGFAVNGTAWMIRQCGNILRYAQTGKVQTYALSFLAGVILLLYWVVHL